MHDFLTVGAASPLQAAGVVALILALAIGGSSHTGAANPLPQGRDLAPAWNLVTPVGPASSTAAPFRDPQTHALLSVRP